MMIKFLGSMNQHGQELEDVVETNYVGSFNVSVVAKGYRVRQHGTTTFHPDNATNNASYARFVERLRLRAEKEMY